MRKTLVLVTALTGFAAAGPALAHHSFAMFDNTKTVSVQGTVAEWQWTNPHTFIDLIVVTPDGKSTKWPLEGQSPNILVRQGWSATAFKVGDKITVTAHPLKSGEPGGSVMAVTLADGKVMGRGPGA